MMQAATKCLPLVGAESFWGARETFDRNWGSESTSSLPKGGPCNQRAACFVSPVGSANRRTSLSVLSQIVAFTFAGVAIWPNARAHSFNQIHNQNARVGRRRTMGDGVRCRVS